jgi:branched-chain amino acid transport system ATP-binding protein
LLKVERINAGYFQTRILHEVSIEIGEREVVALVGANGAGKSTLVKVLSGLIKPTSGKIVLNGEEVTGASPKAMVNRGVILVPEGRWLFPLMTTLENLLIGGVNPRARPFREATLRMVFETFPILQERRNQEAGTLSGGQQQMLAIGRGLMAKPNLLILDEPSLGLGPLLVAEIFRVMKQLKEKGVTTLLVEQNIRQSLAISDHGYVIENGSVVLQGTGSKLLEDERTKRAYLGM